MNGVKFEFKDIITKTTKKYTHHCKINWYNTTIIPVTYIAPHRILNVLCLDAYRSQRSVGYSFQNNWGEPFFLR